MLHDFSEIGLSVVKNLNTRILNISLTKLAENDTAILPPNDYIPKVWECKWYNDETIAGYSKGDIVWKWALTESEFLANYASLVLTYAADNARLCSYFKYSPLNYNSEKARYLNVISGYSEDGRQVFPMLFDYCFNYSTGRYDPTRTVDGKNRIEIYVSLFDDNKSLLSDTSHWKNISIRTNGELSAYLSNEISSMLDLHVTDYHLDGMKTYAEFDSLLLAKDLSNFNLSDVYNTLKVKDHATYVNSQGFDYVVKFGKISSTTEIVNNIESTALQETLLFKWYRLWSSGYLEHGGTVEVPQKAFKESTDAEDYLILVDLAWKDASGEVAPVYDYDPDMSSYYGTEFDLQYFAKTGSKMVRSPIRDSIGLLDKKHRYTISLTPVTMLSSDISASQLKYKPFELISSHAYPQEVNDDLNLTWMNYEVHEQKNESFKLTRSVTRDLTDLSSARYIQYYTTGYIAKPNRDYNIAACVVKNLKEAYFYTGSPVSITGPDGIELWTNDGDLLECDKHYKVMYPDGADLVNVGTVTFWISSIYPYRGSMIGHDAVGTELKFRIAYEMSDRTHRLYGISTEYKYGKKDA